MKVSLQLDPSQRNQHEASDSAVTTLIVPKLNGLVAEPELLAASGPHGPLVKIIEQPRADTWSILLKCHQNLNSLATFCGHTKICTNIPMQQWKT